MYQLKCVHRIGLTGSLHLLNFFKKKISKIVNINIGIKVLRNITLTPTPNPIAIPIKVEKYFLFGSKCCVCRYLIMKKVVQTFEKAIIISFGLVEM